MLLCTALVTAEEYILVCMHTNLETYNVLLTGCPSLRQTEDFILPQAIGELTGQVRVTSCGAPAV